MSDDVLRNPKDPLHNQEDAARALFRKFGEISNGFPLDIVCIAAMNVLVNSLRTAYPTRAQAFKQLEQFYEQLKNMIGDNYDAAGKRRNVFPFTQFIKPQLFTEDEKFN